MSRPRAAAAHSESYRGRPFQVKSRAELERHVAEVKALFGESLALRRRVFLGAANARCWLDKPGSPAAAGGAILWR